MESRDVHLGVRAGHDPRQVRALPAQANVRAPHPQGSAVFTGQQPHLASGRGLVQRGLGVLTRADLGDGADLRDGAVRGWVCGQGHESASFLEGSLITITIETSWSALSPQPTYPTGRAPS